jgi:hypothetical protein
MKTMKKLFCFLFLFFTAFSFNSLCQIRVFSNNYVGINFSTTPSSRFVINAAGNSAYQAWIYNPNISTTGAALATISEKGSGTGTSILSLVGQTYIGSSNYLYGIKGTAYSSTIFTSGRTYGLYGEAGNAATGYNYGVYGYLYGTQYGAAVFGTINGLGDVGLTAQFAGYFRGDVKCENIIYATSFQTISDEKYKTNVADIDPTDALSNISKLSPKKYNLKQFQVTQKGADTVSVKNYYDESGQLFKKAKYGVIAQDLQKIYPDLVYQDNDGNLTVDYTGLIPIMIKALQAQQKKIEDLEVLINALKNQ